LVTLERCHDPIQGDRLGDAFIVQHRRLSFRTQGLGFTVHHPRDFSGERSLHFVRSWISLVIANNVLDFGGRDEGKISQVRWAHRVWLPPEKLKEGTSRGFVTESTRVDSYLVKVKYRAHGFVQPDCVAGAFSKLFPTIVGHQRQRQTVRIVVVTGFASNEIRSCRDISPLVRSADLNTAVHGLVKMEKVVSLQELVRELGERKALVMLA